MQNYKNISLFILTIFCLNITSPILSIISNSESDKVLICTIEGLKWVKYKDARKEKNTQKNCNFCILKDYFLGFIDHSITFSLLSSIKIPVYSHNESFVSLFISNANARAPPLK